jgi:hypothetical protein
MSLFRFSACIKTLRMHLSQYMIQLKGERACNFTRDEFLFDALVVEFVVDGEFEEKSHLNTTGKGCVKCRRKWHDG